MGGNQGSLFLPSRGSNPLKSEWQRHVLACSGYLELGMFDSAAMVLEEIAPEDKNRTEILGMRVQLYMAAKKWDMAAAVASHPCEGRNGAGRACVQRNVVVSRHITIDDERHAAKASDLQARAEKERGLFRAFPFHAAGKLSAGCR
jgi:hypothetical protein